MLIHPTNISSELELDNFINNSSDTKSYDKEFNESWMYSVEETEEYLSNARQKIYSKTIGGKRFNKINIKSIEFSACVFIECDFVEVDFFHISFEDTTFKNCRFYRCEFNETLIETCHLEYCYIKEIGFFESTISKSIISNSRVHRINWNFCLDGMAFDKCEIIGNDFLGMSPWRAENTEDTSTLVFSSCEMTGNKFEHNDITIHIRDSVFNTNSFIDTILSKNSFVNVKREKDNTSNSFYNFIDLQTLSKSENLPLETLVELFSITAFNSQDYVRDFFQEIKYENVFISFSFKNLHFARLLSQNLLLKGVKTWFWPEDAPGGKRTKDIMYKGIQENDRVIFICSEDSLKSEACHYELSEARKKESQLWKDVLFPVRIDNSIFDEEFIRGIRKYKKDLADEWIANIEWLREYNVLDFTDFNILKYDSDKFGKAINSLVSDLRKPIEKEKA